MKDYIVSYGMSLGHQLGYTIFTAVSCGNHALSVAKYAQKINAHTLLFVTSGSTKRESIGKIPNTKLIPVKTNGRNAIYEEVYDSFCDITNNRIYNLNVSNEFMLDGAKSAALEIALSGLELPTHVLAASGNGTYIAGIGKGFYELGQLELLKHIPKCVPLGMRGAFPFESAMAMGKPIVEYKGFHYDEKKVELAEGIMAVGSYSMPQLVQAVKLTTGFSLGDIDNEGIKEAYLLLSKDELLMKLGAVPEPTGIVSLAAAMHHKSKFSKEDILLLSFTGHGAKNLEEITEALEEKNPFELRILLASAISKNGRPDINVSNGIIVDSQIPKHDLDKIIDAFVSEVSR